MLRAISISCLAIGVIALGAASNVRADELRPILLELEQFSEDIWHINWQVSSRSTIARRQDVILPQVCSWVKPIQSTALGNAIKHSGELTCSSALYGQQIGLPSLRESTTDALLRIKFLAEKTYTLRLTNQAWLVTIPNLDQSATSNVAVTYTVLGIEHILFGFDHLLFVIALVLLLSAWRTVIWAVTAFTVSHSITLIGTTLGWFGLAQRPVEAIIALSIVFLAAEILKSKPDQLRLSQRLPWLVAFSFGLLHGFGFAGALAEIGLPQNDRPLALLMFNLGVELGQILIVCVALALLGAIRKVSKPLAQWTRTASAYAIGILATFWLIQRLAPLG